MTRIAPAQRVPTGSLDGVVGVACDRTVQPPVLLITQYRRPVTGLGDDEFQLQHVTSIQVQYAELLLERIREALAPQTHTMEHGPV